MIKDYLISRTAAGATTLVHTIAGGTYSAAPTLVTDGFYIKTHAGRNYDAYEALFRFDATADATTQATIRTWYYVPDHAGGTWVAGSTLDHIGISTASSVTAAPIRRVPSVPVAATRMYLQVVSVVGTAPMTLSMTVYGLEGNVASDGLGGSGGGGGGVSPAAGAPGLGADTFYSVSRNDFTAAKHIGLTDTLVLTFPVGFFTVTLEHIQSVTVWNLSGIATIYTPEDNAFVWDGVSDLQVVGATFAATDLAYDVELLGPPRVPALRADGSTSVSTTILPMGLVGPDGARTPSGATSAAPIVTTSAYAQATHTSPVNFTVAYTSNVTITCAGAPFVISDANCHVVYVLYKPAATGVWSKPLINGLGGVSLAAAANVITVAGAGTPFVAGDEYWVGVQQRIASGGGGAAGGGDALYISPADFTVTYTAATQLTLTGMAFTPAVSQFVSVTQIDSTGMAKTYTPDANAFNWDPATGILTVTSATFAVGDLGYRVFCFGPDKSYTQATNSKRVQEISPISSQHVWENLLTSAALPFGATYFYPSSAGLSMAGYRNFVAGLQVGASATVTIEGSLDTTGTDWFDISRSGYDVQAGAAGVANWSGTNAIISYEGLEIPLVRIKVVVVAINAAMQIDVRRTAL